MWSTTNYINFETEKQYFNIYFQYDVCMLLTVDTQTRIQRGSIFFHFSIELNWIQINQLPIMR